MKLISYKNLKLIKMTKVKIIISFLVIFFSISCSEEKIAPINLVPKPVQFVQKKGSFTLSRNSSISAIDKSQRINELVELAQNMVLDRTGLALKVKNNGQGLFFGIINNPDIGEEGYKISINEKGIFIHANNPAGIFYGLQTFRQMLPISKSEKVTLPFMEITDYPRLSWRGLHLDVGRHFFPPTAIKRYIDLMAMYKINVFHWHLTEDQGWRIEIKKYPKLTSVGAWRNKVGFPSNQEKGFNTDDGKPYGGFYTQEDVKEIVEYARVRNITVVPEIEIPGHSKAAVVSYPEFYCFPDQKLEVRSVAGISDGVYCAGKDETFQFLEDVLDEVMALFPSKLIHIGGDEAPKRNWAKCSNCQRRIKSEGLKDENELQSYFVKRIENYLNYNNRQLIGWDDVFDEGLAQNSTVMAWRGMAPGIEAAELGHNVVMTPRMPTYLNRAQSINPVTKHDAVNPLTSHNGRVTTLQDIYEFNPVPDELKKDAVKHIIGVQACLWSEHIPNLKLLEYKAYPRAIALAEVGWTPQHDRDWNDFYKRFTGHLPQLSFYEVEYGQPSYDVKIEVAPSDDNKNIFVQFLTETPGTVYFTTDGSEPNKQSKIYHKNLEIKKSETLKARMYRPDGSAGRITEQEVIFHKAIGKKATYNIPYSQEHHGGGDYALTDGLDYIWQGFQKRDIDVVIDLGEIMEINRITTNWWYDIDDWVLRPLEVSYEISLDGKIYYEVYQSKNINPENVYNKGTLNLTHEMENGKARFIRLKAKNQMVLPSWHKNTGGGTWIFVDELIVE